MLHAKKIAYLLSLCAINLFSANDDRRSLINASSSSDEELLILQPQTSISAEIDKFTCKDDYNGLIKWLKKEKSTLKRQHILSIMKYTEKQFSGVCEPDDDLETDIRIIHNDIERVRKELGKIPQVTHIKKSETFDFDTALALHKTPSSLVSFIRDLTCITNAQAQRIERYLETYLQKKQPKIASNKQSFLNAKNEYERKKKELQKLTSILDSLTRSKIIMRGCLPYQDEDTSNTYCCKPDADPCNLKNNLCVNTCNFPFRYLCCIPLATIFNCLTFPCCPQVSYKGN